MNGEKRDMFTNYTRSPGGLVSASTSNLVNGFLSSALMFMIASLVYWLGALTFCP